MGSTSNWVSPAASRETVDAWSATALRTTCSVWRWDRLTWSGRRAEELLEKTAVASGLSRRGDYDVLALLRRAEPEQLLTPLQVAQQLLTSQSGMTGKLDRLERQGLVQRTPDPEDRRAIRLGITDSGRALIDEAFTTSLSVYQSMLAGFTPTEARDLTALLDKLLSRLDELSVMRRPWSAG